MAPTDSVAVGRAPAECAPIDEATSLAIAEVSEQIVELTHRVRTVMKSMALAIDPALQPFGLKMLRMLQRRGPMQASALAEALFVDRSVVSRQVRQLEELALIELRDDPADGRARILALSAHAVTRLSGLGAGGHELMQVLLRTWAMDDLRQFAGYIARMNETEFLASDVLGNTVEGP
ncbi:MAG: MarR family winged helix-turn-helix transcriptional regulator [Microbacteriaceae bacterium]